ncbi:MAG: peptide ABC transporter substrate-binding protein [Planctomycetes bacterium]|nr:peptide ABC transporter substrate-binding protein [Planctomycetota bacterium]
MAAVRFLCILLAFAAAAACRRAPDAASTLRFHNMSEPRTLDPAGAISVAEKNLLLALCEGLTSLDPRTARPVPAVASRYTALDGGRTLQFDLRECRWSNGDPVTASNFRDSWLRVLEPATASPLVNLLFSIRGARAFHEGRAPRDQVGIAAPDTRTLIVRFDHPDPRFLQLCASSPLVPVHPRAAATAGFYTRAEAFIGNGPFVLAERTPNLRIVMIKNRSYWDASNVTIEKIVAWSTDSKQAAVDAFRGGQSDWVDDFPAGQASSWLGSAELSTSPYLATFFVRFNTHKKPFDDRRVREAVHRAIDRAAICRGILKLGQRPATGFVPACMETVSDYHCISGPDFDPVRARELLAEAGYPDGSGLPPVEFQYDTNEDYKKICEAIQAMLRENLNMRIYLINKEKKVHLDDEENLRYGGLSRGSWIADYMDPMTFLEILAGDSPDNRTGFQCKEYDELLERARAEGDPKARLETLQKAEEILVRREFPITPIYEYVKQTLVDRKRIVGGFYENPLGVHPMKWIRLASSGK